MLEISGLCKQYGDTIALDNVDLSIQRGQVLGLLGPNGAGKTTLVSIIAGLRRADAGTICVGKVDAIARPASARRLVGIAPQDLGFYPVLSVRSNLRFFAELAGLRAAEIDRRIDETAEALDLSPLLGRRSANLSGGQKRRLHTAIAMIHRPPLLLLDEPTAGADVASRNRVLALVRKLAAEGCAVCYTTHYLPEIEALDATVAILGRGRILAQGSASDLIKACGTPSVVLTFDGDVPAELLGRAGVGRLDQSSLTVETDRPAAALEAVFGAAAHPVSDRLLAIETHRPSLEAVYLSLTGDVPPAAAGGAGEEESGDDNP